MNAYRRAVSAVLCPFLFAAGCKVEQAPTRAELKLEKAQKKQNVAGDTTTEVPAGANDDAALVLAACGKPISDRTLAIFSKLNHGPVRELRYRGVQPVLMEFVPSHAAVQGVLPGRLKAELPAGDVWVFDDAYMEHEEMLTTNRLAVYLPCAAKALARED